jgi:hypothetical protein
VKEKGLKKQKEGINELIFTPNDPKVHQTKNKKRLIFLVKRPKKYAQTTPFCAKKVVF